MKITNFIITVFFVLSLHPIALYSQTNSKFLFGVESEIIYSDVNYGNEFPLAYLENEDYTSQGAYSDAAFGFNIGVGLHYLINQKNELRFSTGYTLLADEAGGDVTGLRTTVNRPLSIEIPVSVDGRVNYSFLDFGADWIYNFKGNMVNGIFVSAGMNYLVNLKTDWKVDVIFERGNQETQNELPEFIAQDLDDLLVTNFRFGYNIIIDNKYRITPSLGMNIGLNQIGKDNINPAYFSFNLRFNLVK